MAAQLAGPGPAEASLLTRTRCDASVGSHILLAAHVAQPADRSESHQGRKSYSLPIT